MKKTEEQVFVTCVHVKILQNIYVLFPVIGKSFIYLFLQTANFVLNKSFCKSSELYDINTR